MKLGFNVKYGTNIIEIPDSSTQSVRKMRKSNLWKTKVTIYNDIEASATEDRHFDRFVIDRCNIQGGFVTKTNGTLENIVNVKTVITRDVEHYKSPAEYKLLPKDIRQNYYTARPGDFIVLGVVDDVITTSLEFKNLQSKYKDNGINVTTVDASINGFDVDNISITNA